MITENAVSDCDSKVSEAFQKDEKFDGVVQKEQVFTGNIGPFADIQKFAQFP